MSTAPYDRGNYLPDEHPLTGLGRMMKGVFDIQAAVPDLPVLGSAFTYLRQFSVNLAAGMVAGGHCAMAGFGRMAFAHPGFVQEARKTGCLDKRSVCITCGNCALLLRAGVPAGCVLHDKEVYTL
jgi:2,4-dienoyl-CoA reductase-like NADH-dependent reductase (Old Yellow Enzyme family)